MPFIPRFKSLGFSGMSYKKQAELDFWTNLVNELTKDFKDHSQKEQKLMSVCHEITYPRYKKDLYLQDVSFDGKKVLDIGCGPHGGLIGFKNCEKYGVDHLIDEYEKLGYPLKKHGIKYYCAKSEKLPFPDIFFDIVICVNALDHVDSLKKTVHEISRVLKSNGRFIAQINFHEEPTSTEPIVLNHDLLTSFFLENNMVLIKRIFQYHISNEDRYYYEYEKNNILF